MGCKCTCGNCCTHGKDAKAQQKVQQQNKNEQMKRDAKKREARRTAEFYRPKK